MEKGHQTHSDAKSEIAGKFGEIVKSAIDIAPEGMDQAASKLGGVLGGNKKSGHSSSSSHSAH